MSEDLHEIAATTSEHVQIAGMRIALHRFLHLERQAIHPSPHIGVTDCQRIRIPLGTGIIAATEPSARAPVPPRRHPYLGCGPGVGRPVEPH